MGRAASRNGLDSPSLVCPDLTQIQIRLNLGASAQTQILAKCSQSKNLLGKHWLHETLVQFNGKGISNLKGKGLSKNVSDCIAKKWGHQQRLFIRLIGSVPPWPVTANCPMSCLIAALLIWGKKNKGHLLVGSHHLRLNFEWMITGWGLYHSFQIFCTNPGKNNFSANHKLTKLQVQLVLAACVRSWVVALKALVPRSGVLFMAPVNKYGHPALA